MPDIGVSKVLLDPTRPYRSLSLLFLAWKFLLLAVVLAAPGIGYDTSTDLLLHSSTSNDCGGNVLRRTVNRLVRWDAIYFTQTARRGYVFEQEWAFGWGYTTILRHLARLITVVGRGGGIETVSIGFIGIALAHVCHWASVLVLYELTKVVFGLEPEHRTHATATRKTDARRADTQNKKTKDLAFLSAALHVISPAGVFLCAPYAESPFALLNFTAFYALVKARTLSDCGRDSFAAVHLLSAGALFGLATTLRGNGIFSGVVLLAQACELALHLVQSLNNRSRVIAVVRRLCATIISGLLMAVMAIWPQYVAYKEYCVAADVQYRPEWCQHRLPSIYAWVQKKYWGVGFLQYWTLSNVPLFLLAAPMLLILFSSCWWASEILRMKHSGSDARSSERASKRQNAASSGSSRWWLLFNLSLPEILLAILALTTYHIQIINRLSSGYVVWYWWLATILQTRSNGGKWKVNFDIGMGIIKWMTGYALIQAGLFASFLPPA